MDKKIKISWIVIIVVLISVIMTMIIMGQNKNETNHNFSPEVSQQNDDEENEMSETSEVSETSEAYVNINNQRYTLKLENNSTALAFAKRLPLSFTMNDLNGNEKYVYLNEPLPTDMYNPVHIEAGDVMLFNDDCLVIFYRSFETGYSYSKIGHIDNLPELDSGNVFVDLSRK